MTACTKKSYPDIASARLALVSILKSDRRENVKKPVRAYPCDICPGWHLTSKPHSGRSRRWR